MDYQKCRYGPLDVLEVQIKPKELPTFILFHGYGADAHDLLPFSQILDPSRRATWLFPNRILKFISIHPIQAVPRFLWILQRCKMLE